MPQPTERELVYFLHIPKTSGSSVRNFLIDVFGPDHVSPQLAWDHLLTTPSVVNDDTRVVSGHLGGLLPLWLKRWPRIITMLRDPVARALSHINHVQRDATHLLHLQATGLSVREYCGHPALRKTIENFQSRYLASLSFSRALIPPPADHAAGWAFGDRAIQFENALYSLDRTTGLFDEAVRSLTIVDAVGLCEAHGPSLQLFMATLGLETRVGLAETRLNVGKGGLQLEQLSRDERAALEELNEVDRAVYEQARKMFVAACRKHAIAPDFARRAPAAVP